MMADSVKTTSAVLGAGALVLTLFSASAAQAQCTPVGFNPGPDFPTQAAATAIAGVSAYVGTLVSSIHSANTAFLPDGSRAYVTCENGGSVAVVDAAKHAVLSTIKLSGENVRPMGAVASPDGRYVYVTTGRGRTVVTIDTATNEPIASVEVGLRPWGIAISADGRTLYTANGPSNDVAIVDVASRTVTARVAVGEGPWGLAVVP